MITTLKVYLTKPPNIFFAFLYFPLLSFTLFFIFYFLFFIFSFLYNHLQLN